MKKHLLGFALLAAMSVTPVAFAEESESPFSWNAAVTSEYLFRGISQSDDHPALQAGLDYSFESGFYVGAWASTVDFGYAGDDETNAELDYYIGFSKDLSDDWNWDIQLVRYTYMGEPAGLDYAYNELINKFAYGDHLELTLGYTNDYLNIDENSFYYGIGGTWELGNEFNMSIGAGHTTISGPGENYTDYSIGVDRAFGPANVSLQYIGTDGNAADNFGSDATDDRFVLTVSFEG